MNARPARISALTTLTGLAVLVSLGACGSSLTTVPVKGAEKEVALLTGAWQGKFDGMTNGRRGVIEFRLDVGRHSADGQVTVFDADDSKVQQLRIEFIEIANSLVSGKIAKYVDPDCNCTVETEFEGSLTGDYIVGTYKIRPENGEQAQHGQWTVERVDL